MDNKILSIVKKPIEIITIALAILTLSSKYSCAQHRGKEPKKEKVSMIISDEDSLVVKKPENWKERWQLRKELNANMTETKNMTEQSIERILEHYNPKTPEKKRFTQTVGVVARYRGYLAEYRDWYKTYYENIILVKDTTGNVVKTKKGKDKKRLYEEILLKCNNDVTQLKFDVNNEFVRYNGAKDSLVYKPAADKFKNRQ